jgi:hypothetical protein
MKFSLMGFTQEVGFRVFTFSGLAEDSGRVEFTVRADLALSRRYAIRMQELPLLCLRLLERDTPPAARDFTLTEDEMRIHALKISASKPAHFKRGPAVTQAQGGV